MCYSVFSDEKEFSFVHLLDLSAQTPFVMFILGKILLYYHIPSLPKGDVTKPCLS